MQLCITYPDHEQLFDIAWLEIETSQGSFTFYEGHAPTILSLSPEKSVVLRLASGKEETVHIPSGIIHVTRTNITILSGE